MHGIKSSQPSESIRPGTTHGRTRRHRHFSARSDDGGSRRPRTRRALDGLNFCLADAVSVLGPFLGVYLLTQHGWDQATIGLVAMVGGIVPLAVQVPVGALIDGTRFKRAALVAALAAVSLAALAIVLAPTVPVVVLAGVIIAVAGAVFRSAVAALTLGLADRGGLAARIGRNGAFDHAGNVFAAIVAGVLGWALSQQAVFLMVPVFSGLAVICVLCIAPGEIDHVRARGATGAQPAPVRVWALARDRPLAVLAGCVALFHLANAAMLPLVGQKLALAHVGYETAMMSACVVAAQLVMLPVALLVGRHVERWGGRRILMSALAVLALRGILYTLWDAPGWLVAVQLLDGVGAGAMGVMVPLIVADLTRGSGRYNLSLSAVVTFGGIAAALSNAVAGAVVVMAGYDAAFLTLAAAALSGLGLLWLALAEPGSSAALTSDAGWRLHTHHAG